MHAKDPEQCHGADEDELVVPLRLGDSCSDMTAARNSIDKYLASSCGQGIKRALVTGVLHYGRAGIHHPKKHSAAKDAAGYYGYRFARSSELDARAESIVDAIVAHLQTVHGLTVRVRSEPNADFDLCFSVFSLHILNNIPMASYKASTKLGRKKDQIQTKVNEDRLPGQTLLRNDVVALIHSSNFPLGESPPVLQQEHAAALPLRKLPCSYTVPEMTRGKHRSSIRGMFKQQWKSILVHYGRLTNVQFATLCASSCMASRQPAASTMCAVPSAPLGCTELVDHGPVNMNMNININMRFFFSGFFFFCVFVNCV